MQVSQTTSGLARPGEMINSLDISAIKNLAQLSVILYLLTALAWALVGFVWIFGAQQIENQNCGHDSNTYWVGPTCHCTGRS